MGEATGSCLGSGSLGEREMVIEELQEILFVWSAMWSSSRSLPKQETYGWDGFGLKSRK